MKKTTTDYLLLLFILAITGFMSFFGFRQASIFAAPAILYIFHQRRLIVPKEIKITLGICFVWLTIQTIVYQGTMTVPITQTIRFYVLALLAIILSPNFKRTFPRIMFILCSISLLLWCGCQLSSGFQQVLCNIADLLPEFRSEEFLEHSTNPSKSIYIYTINTEGSIRNSGPFWEPGIFTVFIALALAINLFNGLPLFSRENIILTLTNITTFSTAGYIAMSILLTGYILIYKKSLLVKLCWLAILPYLVVYVSSLDFMQDKIKEDLAATDKAYTRFGAMYYHWEKIELSPLTGYGSNELPQTATDAILADMEIENLVSPNGITIMAVTWGIPLAIVYFMLLFRSTYAYTDQRSKAVHWLLFITIIASIFSQDITNRDFFYVLAFMGACMINPPQYAKN